MQTAEEKIPPQPRQEGLAARLRPVLVATLVGGLVGAVAVTIKRPPRVDLNWALKASILGWVIFSLYWTVAATNARAQTAESRVSRKIHELLINAAYVLLLLPPAMSFTIPVLQVRFLPVSPVFVGLGLAIQAGSFALAVWARRTLGSYWSGRIEIKTDHRLVRSGPYRRLRHPIYTAVLGMAVGTSMTIGKVHGLLAVGIIVFAYIRKVRIEESALRQTFGAEYEDYRRASWGFVPGLF